MRRLLLILLLVFTLALPCPAPGASAEDEASLTLMVYMCGSNLESQHAAASADLMEMAASGYDFRKVNLQVMTGGTEKWWTDFPTDAICVYQPARGALRLRQAYESASMGEPGTLDTLLRLGYEQYPARRYALILWNHGGGPLGGVCWDELYGGDHLTMEELVRALEHSPAKEQPLEWIGFDACLMGSAEVARLIAPYARYMIASEETEPGGGWDYAFLKDIEAADGAAAGRSIIDGYFENAVDEGDLTLSLIDLSRVGALADAVDGLFPGLEITGGNYALFSYAARHTRSFGRAGGGSGSYDLIDLASLIGQLSPQRPEQAEAAMRALKEAVLYSRGTEGAGGLSVYHPYANKAEYLNAWSAEYEALGFSGGYADYVARFARYLFGSCGVDWAGLSATTTDRPGVFALPLTEGQRSQLLDASLELLAWDEESGAYASLGSATAVTLEDGILYAGWDGLCLTAADEAGRPLTGPIPCVPLPDGCFGVYVNYCLPGARDSAEASRIIQAETGGMKKAFGSYTFEEDEAETQSMTGSQAQIGSSSSLVDESSVQETESIALSETLYTAELTVSTVSPLSPAGNQALSVPSSVSFDAGAHLTGIALTGIPKDAEIVPASAESILQAQPSRTTMGTSSIEIDPETLVDVEISTFEESQITVDLTDFVLPEPGKEDRPVVHAFLKCQAEADGSVTVRETWLYDPNSDIWSTRGALDTASYSAAVFPVEWKQPVFAEDTLMGFASWKTHHTAAETADAAGWSLKFTALPGGAPLCASFQVTDSQNWTYASAPLMFDVPAAG